MGKDMRKAVNAGSDGMVCVRVRKGNTLRLGRDLYARGGDWCWIVEHDLTVPSVRLAVETDEDIANAERETDDQLAKKEESQKLFQSLRESAREHNAAFARGNAAAEKHLAKELLETADAREQALDKQKQQNKSKQAR